MLRTAVDLETANVALPALEAAGLLGMAEEGGRATVYLPHRVDGLGLDGEWAEVPERDWLAVWKEGLEPVRVGRITVSPPWAAKAGDLVIDPGMAFGTGHHETTTACLGALQAMVLGGRSVLDVGTGSGILAIAAARDGARVVAVDVDPVAVAAAVTNAQINRVQLDVRQGSAADVDGLFDVVVANLDTATLTAVARHLRARLAADGVLIASGVSVERCPQGVAAMESAGLEVLAETGREWVLLRGTVRQ